MLEERCRALVAELGLASPEDVRGVRALTGGVSSDIALVDLGERQICVKFAREKLEVAEDWRAPVHRNRAEYAWLKAAAAVVPDSVPELYGCSPALGGFAMEYIAGDDVYLWKTALLSEASDRGEAASVALVFGRVHAASARPGFDAAAFDNSDDFRALRLEPYLAFTAARHPGVAGKIEALADALYRSRVALVHGDVSPKNILFRKGAPILLDAECATMGDPAFDVAFCLNHLVLKAVHLPRSRRRFLGNVRDFWSSYSALIDWEPATALEERVVALLPALMLARIDGKSPVEYLTDAERAATRATALALLHEAHLDLPAMVAHLGEELGE